MRYAILLPQRVSNLEKENDLLKQQTAIQEKLTELAKRETEVYRVAFEKEKELTDRALKLAEVGKQKPNWELEGLLKAVCFSFTISARTTISRKKPEEMRRITLPLLSSNVSCFRTYVPSGFARPLGICS